MYMKEITHISDEYQILFKVLMLDVLMEILLDKNFLIHFLLGGFGTIFQILSRQHTSLL